MSDLKALDAVRAADQRLEGSLSADMFAGPGARYTSALGIDRQVVQRTQLSKLAHALYQYLKSSTDDVIKSMT